MKKVQNEGADNGCGNREQLDPRVRRTRKLLQDALKSLIHEQGYAKITVQDIAERATVNRATFYAHYVDKDDLAASSLKEEFHVALSQKFTQKPALNQKSLMELAVGVFEFLGNLHDSCPVAAAALQNATSIAVLDTLFEIVESCFAQNGAGSRMFPAASADTAATVIAWSIYGAAQRWSRTKNRPPAETVCREIVEMLLPGVG